MIQISPILTHSKDYYDSIHSDFKFKDDIAISKPLSQNLALNDILVFKLLYHPRGSNIFYSLSREYIYQQNQKNYFNNQLLFTSFRSIDEAYRFIRRNCLCLYFSTKGYEELLIVNCIIPSGSLYFEYTSNGIYGNYYNSNSIILRETDIDIIEKYNYFC